MVITILERNGAAFRMDVECRDRGYLFRFWDENDMQGKQGRAHEVVRRMNYFNADSWEAGVFRKEFEYPSEEDDLYQYIAAFENKLAAVIAA